MRYLAKTMHFPETLSEKKRSLFPLTKNTVCILPLYDALYTQKRERERKKGMRL